jgi:hypothetical protein
LRRRDDNRNIERLGDIDAKRRVHVDEQHVGTLRHLPRAPGRMIDHALARHEEAGDVEDRALGNNLLDRPLRDKTLNLDFEVVKSKAMARDELPEIGVGAKNNVMSAANELKRERHIRLHIALRAECGNRNFHRTCTSQTPKFAAAMATYIASPRQPEGPSDHRLTYKTHLRRARCPPRG